MGGSGLGAYHWRGGSVCLFLTWGPQWFPVEGLLCTHESLRLNRLGCSPEPFPRKSSLILFQVLTCTCLLPGMCGGQHCKREDDMPGVLL